MAFAAGRRVLRADACQTRADCNAAGRHRARSSLGPGDGRITGGWIPADGAPPVAAPVGVGTFRSARTRDPHGYPDRVVLETDERAVDDRGVTRPTHESGIDRQSSVPLSLPSASSLHTRLRRNAAPIRCAAAH